MAKAADFLIALDDGHGPQTAGKRTPYIASLGRSIRENEFNKAVVDLLEVELKRVGFRTLQLAPTDLDTPLITRTNIANRAKADILVSVHFNAMGNTFAYSSAKGFSVHIQEGSTNNSKAYKLAALMVKELAKGTPQTNRGVVKQNLHMTRASVMPAVLVEAGFMDDPTESLLMINKKFHQEVVGELTAAICQYFGVSYQSGNPIQAAQPVANTKGYFLNGDTGPEIKSIQSDLVSIGYKIAVDGIYGKGTETAVRAFQRGNGLAVDGIWGKASQAKLDAVLANVNKKPAVKPTAPKPKEEKPVKKTNEPSKWALKDVQEATKLGISDGTRLHEPITREEAIVIAMRAAGLAPRLK